jgi:arsenite methyltransferase
MLADMKSQPDYGIDAPFVIRNLAVIGFGLLLIGFVPVFHMGSNEIRLTDNFRVTLLITGTICILESILMLVYAKIGKFSHRDRMLALVGWKGDEHVLDVGTGRGLLMIGAAKKLSPGITSAIGIDIWSAKDLSGNTMENTLQNAELEGVKDRVQLLSEDAQKMSFADSTFDVILSNLCLHNIPNAAGRERACLEIARVLKPGGMAVISDFKNTAHYEKAFRAAGLTTERTAPDILRTFPPLRIVTARK